MVGRYILKLDGAYVADRCILNLELPVKMELPGERVNPETGIEDGGQNGGQMRPETAVL